MHQGAGPSRSTMQPAMQRNGHKVKMKVGLAQLSKQGRPGFQVLAGLPEEEDLESVVQQLKQQIQDITRPNLEMKVGKAHSPESDLGSNPTRGKAKRGGRGPGPQLRVKTNGASSSRGGTGVVNRPNATGKQLFVGGKATTEEVEGDLGNPF